MLRVPPQHHESWNLEKWKWQSTRLYKSNRDSKRWWEINLHVISIKKSLQTNACQGYLKRVISHNYNALRVYKIQGTTHHFLNKQMISLGPCQIYKEEHFCTFSHPMKCGSHGSPFIKEPCLLIMSLVP